MLIATDPNTEYRGATTLSVPAPSHDHGDSCIGNTGCRHGDDAPIKRKRVQWTRILDEKLLSLYQESCPQQKGYMARLEALWNRECPEMISKGTSLAQRVRRIKLSATSQAQANDSQASPVEARAWIDPTTTSTEQENTQVQRNQRAEEDQGEICREEMGQSSHDSSIARPATTMGSSFHKDPQDQHDEPNTEPMEEISEELREQFHSELVKTGLGEEGDLSRRQKPRCKGIYVSNRLMNDIDRIIEAEWKKGAKTLWRLNCLVYSGAVTVENRVKKSLASRKIPSLQKREAEITQLRKVIGWLQSELQRQRTRSPATYKQKKEH